MRIWLVYATSSFVYHLTGVDATPFLDEAANIASLGLVLVLPLALLLLLRDARHDPGEPRAR